MLGRIFTVGGYTLLSRLTGFARDIMLAAILGAGPVADAFFVALRLPNHFRAIFAEGAFNAAFVPAYAHLHGKSDASARLFADRIFTLLFAAQVILLVVAWWFMPEVIAILNKALAEVLAMPDIKARFLDLGVVARPSSPEELMALLKADVAKWADVIEKAGIEKK